MNLQEALKYYQMGRKIGRPQWYGAKDRKWLDPLINKGAVSEHLSIDDMMANDWEVQDIQPVTFSYDNFVRAWRVASKIEPSKSLLFKDLVIALGFKV